MVSCAIKAQHDVLHGDPRRKYFRCCRIVCPAKVAVSCVSHYSNCEFLRIRYSCGLTGHGTRDCYATSTAEFHRRSPSAEFISQRPNGGAPSGKPPPCPEPSVY